MTHRGPTRFLIPRWARRAVHLVSALVFASGALWLFLHRFVAVEGEFGPEASPFEHPALVAHGIAAACMLWLFGLLWLAHVRRAWHARRNRGSGGTMVVLLIALATSGLGLYYIGDDAVRSVLADAHWIVGFVASAALPFHIWRGRRAVGADLHAARAAFRNEPDRHAGRPHSSPPQ